MIAKALSIRAPWWWFILHGGKDIENRDWPTNFRGTVYVQASKWWKPMEICEDLQAIRDFCDPKLVELPPGAASEMEHSRGCIVGTVDIVDCIAAPQPQTVSPWFFGDYGFVLANPVAFAKPVPCKGALGFFTVPDDVLARLGVREC